MKKDITTAFLALAILDVMADIALLNSILTPPQEEDDTDKHPLIGRRYIVNDCSYAIDKETGIRVSGLHDKEYIIVSDPYVADVEPICMGAERYSHLFVDVFSVRSARKYRVLFQERGVIED
jgi:hypothetical protein